MLQALIDYLVAVAIVAAESLLIIGFAFLYSGRYNEGGRVRLFGHFDTSPPRGLSAVR
jgi:hypothetical protein